MAKCPQLEDAIPDHIRVSTLKQKELTETADAIIAEMLHTYEFFVANERQLPSEQWKHIKSKEKVRIYRSRRSKKQKNDVQGQFHDEKEPSRPKLLSPNTMEQHQRQAAADGTPAAYDDPIEDEEMSYPLHKSSSGGTNSFSLCEDSALAKVKPSQVPLIVAIGQIEGTLEDVAYGSLANTKYAWLIRDSYVQNESLDGRKILATIQSPSEEDPFRNVTIKWGTADYGVFTTRRDFVMLESQGMAFDSDGERVFYHFVQSVHLDGCPTLELSHNVVRMNFAMCYISRQINAETVEMFGHGFVDLRGDIIENYGVMIIAKELTSCASIVECANMKKLTYLMMLQRRSDASGILHSSKCGVCSKSVSKLGSLLQSSSGCPVCRHVTCSKCSVQKKITVEAAKEITQKNFVFCLSCVLKAKKLSAWDVARARLVS